MPAGQLSARARAARGHQSGTARPPAGLIPPAAVGATFLMLPTVGLLVRMPWSGLRQIFADSDVLAALRLSLICSTATTVVSLLLGIPLAWVLARSRFPGLGALRTVVTLPLVLPPVAGGVALFLAFGRYGLVGLYLDRWFGLTIPFTVYGVIVAETFVSMPFLVVTVAGALRGADQGTEEAAATLGATPLRIFATITLPGVLPSVGAGAVLCWARALGEFGATITFAGSFPGTTETLPIAAYSSFEGSGQIGMAITLSLLLLAISVLVLVVLRDRWLGALR